MFVAVAHGQKHLFGEVEIASLFAVILVDVGLDDRIHRTGFFAKTTENTLGEVNVVARGAAGPVFTQLRLDGDRHGRTDRLTKLAGNAALFTVGVAPERVQAAKARRHRRFLFRVENRYFS